MHSTIISHISVKCQAMGGIAKMAKVWWKHLIYNKDIFGSFCSMYLNKRTKSFVPAQDGEYTDMSCLVFRAPCKNGKISAKCQVYNKGIFTNFRYFSQLWNIDIVKKGNWLWVNGVICGLVICSWKSQKAFLQQPKNTKYLNNRSWYENIVCAILFSSRWRVYWHKLFTGLNTLQKWQNFNKMPSL